MQNKAYKKQVRLLLDVLPEVSKETCFALHGGTAINLFVRELPRLSVDIDLTYVPIEDRSHSLENIGEALERLKAQLEAIIPQANVTHKQDVAKLLVSQHETSIKIEVNTTGRGCLAPPSKLPLCKKAQNEFDAFCMTQVVPLGQLYGGKISAALDRQHPRDIFDIKYLLENEGFSEEIKKGFILSLLSSDRPIHEILFPIFQDQRSAMMNQFSGMTTETFSYQEYEQVRSDLLHAIHANLTDEDRRFLLDFTKALPDWSMYNFEKFPAVQWKLQNLGILKNSNLKKFHQQYEELQRQLSR